ncbi:hypothetical protein AC249_AIPGENE21278 [Exaiptasia diaphana]|nr:hypothetical protein AC249_AIPGENE21278 [Exaiptasia diaphana]
MSTTFESSRDLSVDDALFNENKVDELVESFWTKFDKKIEHAVLLQQETQRNQEQAILHELQEKEKKKKLAIEKHTEYFSFSYAFIFIIEPHKKLMQPELLIDSIFFIATKVHGSAGQTAYVHLQCNQRSMKNVLAHGDLQENSPTFL